MVFIDDAIDAPLTRIAQAPERPPEVELHGPGKPCQALTEHPGSLLAFLPGRTAGAFLAARRDRSLWVRGEQPTKPPPCRCTITPGTASSGT